MIIPYEDALHWRTIRLSIAIGEDELDVSGLRTALGLAADADLAWILAEATEPVHTHAWLFSRDLEVDVETESAGQSADTTKKFYTLELSTYRYPVAEHDSGIPQLSHERFFTSLILCISSLEYLYVVSTTDAYYSAQSASWRMRLLADPPRLEDYQAELGKISIAGVKLRFEDSPSGLLEVTLDISPTGHEYRASIIVLNQVVKSDLDSVYRLITTQSEEFASLFIEPV